MIDNNILNMENNFVYQYGMESAKEALYSCDFWNSYLMNLHVLKIRSCYVPNIHEVEFIAENGEYMDYSCVCWQDLLTEFYREHYGKDRIPL